MAIFDILDVKIIDKFDQKMYKFVDAYWTQTGLLIDDVINKSNDCSSF